jgi:hypothetical protein
LSFVSVVVDLEDFGEVNIDLMFWLVLWHGVHSFDFLVRIDRPNQNDYLEENISI